MFFKLYDDNGAKQFCGGRQPSFFLIDSSSRDTGVMMSLFPQYRESAISIDVPAVFSVFINMNLYL